MVNACSGRIVGHFQWYSGLSSPQAHHHWQVGSSLLSIVSPIGGPGTKLKARLSCQFKIKGIVVLAGSVACQGPDRIDMLVDK